MTVRPSFASGTQEDRAYQALLGLGVSASSMNSGCHRVNYSGRSDGGSPGSGDLEISACEAWGTLSAQTHRLPTSATTLLGSQAPWVLPASPSPSLQAVLTRIDGEISRLRTLHHNASDADLRVARGLYNFVFSSSGLGLTYTNNVQESSAGAALLQSAVNCSESFSVLKAVFGRAGLSVNPAFVFLPGGHENAHIATEFVYGGRSYLMDSSQRDPLNPSGQDGFDASHATWVRISLREFWAWHFNNRAEIAADAGNVTRAEGFFALARRLDANNPHFANNLGLRLDAAGRSADAQTAYREAISVDSRFIEPYVNLGGSLIDGGRSRDALIPLAQGLAISSTDPRILYNLALAHSNLGNNRQALNYVTQGIQQNSSNASYFQLRAELRSRLGFYTEARQDLAVATRLGSD